MNSPVGEIGSYPGYSLIDRLRQSPPEKVLWIALAPGLGAVCALMASTQMSAGLAIFYISALGLLAALSYSLRAGAIYALLYFCVKPAFWRLAYHLDSVSGTSASVDLLRYSGGLFLAVVCFIVIAKGIIERRPLARTRLDMVIMLFMGVYAVSVLNPHTSLFTGLAGLERNIFPTLFLFFVGKEVIRTERDFTVFLKAVSLFALIVLAYGLKHSLSGLWGFEQTYFNDKFFSGGLDGWLTVGINGIEFRTFGAFYGYMEFTFTAALWGALLLSQNYKPYGKLWSLCKWAIGLVLLALLVSTIERTVIIMIISGLLTAWYIRSAKSKHKMILLASTAIAISIVSITTVFQDQLEQSGVAKLQRLAEIADPSEATSIQDRIDRMWAPTLAIIAANPMGVGAGYGSGTIASESASGSEFYVQPHNELFQKTLESGWIGGTLFVAIFVLLLRKFYRAALNPISPYTRNLIAGGAGVLVAFILCAQINLPFSGAPGSFFWFTVGGIVSLIDRTEIKTSVDQTDEGN